MTPESEKCDLGSSEEPKRSREVATSSENEQEQEGFEEGGTVTQLPL